jgi:formate dehydrogenase iron-sulfur subunit
MTSTHKIPTTSQRALLIDVKRCIGCRGCVAACKQAHGINGDDTDSELGAQALTALVDIDADLHVRRLCMHCLDPSCASVCPVSAFQRTPAGPVTYDASKCLGCRYCMLACPFGVPKYEWNAVVPAVRKCDLCAERGLQGLPTACSEVCPAEATLTGPRDELLAEARRRLAADPHGYHPHIYGEHEVGGTSVLILSPVPFERLGLTPNLPTTPMPSLTWAALEKVPGFVTVGGAALMALFWITHRREEVALAAAARQEKSHDSR